VHAGRALPDQRNIIDMKGINPDGMYAVLRIRSETAIGEDIRPRISASAEPSI
jgi:hypothetical protein